MIWSNQPPDASPNLVLDVRGEQGEEITSYPFVPPTFQGTPVVLGSPDGHSLLVGWTTNDFAASIKLLRFDCVGPD